MLLEVKSMYELARKFARVRFNIVKIQRWWRGRVTHLTIKRNQADHGWTQQEKTKRAGLSRRETLTLQHPQGVPLEVRLPLIQEEIHRRRKVYVESRTCWQQGVIPLHNISQDQDQVDVVRQLMLSCDQSAKSKVLQDCKPKLRLEFNTEELDRLIDKGERIAGEQRALERQLEERERREEQRKWKVEAEAAAKGN